MSPDIPAFILFDKINELASRVSYQDTIYYRWSIDYDIDDEKKIFIEIDIERDAELVYAYEEARDIFGSMAEKIRIRFDSVEKEGRKHYLTIVI